MPVKFAAFAVLCVAALLYFEPQRHDVVGGASVDPVRPQKETVRRGRPAAARLTASGATYRLRGVYAGR